ncbi:alkylated DNA repair protein alkB homolog 7 [Fistulifera solaris]|uniref:Alkylated DNA repair protein alkB homolog 7 n=1 Tax=Fistulifera solaris TaxID=1519565 RepID=A0A1Z5K1K8_FISSO|nr:alkylated DNA repair protein alkB homolog 7 [Fistulifera solaris]|eukprot:GAX20174.1 alkylated DNA repair protein alkB homolog 7 [Fistulifera solaris]
MVDNSHAPDNFDQQSAVVFPDVITVSEHDALVAHVEPLLKRRRYEKGHWDSVILQYKEVELAEEASAVNDVFERIRKELEPYKRMEAPWLPCHAIDLRKDGELNEHVDSVRFSGDLVAGLSLLSSSIMRLKPDASTNPDESVKGHVDLYLPSRSLYVLSGVSRYSYTHELLPGRSLFKGNAVDRDRRISIIFRDAKVG